MRKVDQLKVMTRIPRCDCKRVARSHMRQIDATKRCNFYNKFLSDPGTREFHQLLSRQLKPTSSSAHPIIANGHKLTDVKDQAEALADIMSFLLHSRLIQLLMKHTMRMYSETTPGCNISLVVAKMGAQLHLMK